MTKNYIYVIELKLNGSAEEALAQIDEKEYALPFASDSPYTLQNRNLFLFQTP